MSEIDKQHVDKLINAGFNYHQQGKLDDAEPLYQKALSLDNNNPEIYNLIGLLKLQKDLVEEAIEYVLKAISIFPTEYFYEILFQAFIRKEDYKSILGLEETIKTLYPNCFSLLFYLAFAYKNQKMHKEALKYYEKALRINPESYEGWINVANIYSIEARTADAVSAMNVCYALRPNDDDTAYFMGIDYLRIKNYAKGLPLFEKRMSKKVAYASHNKTLPNLIRDDNDWKGENIKDKNIFVYYEAGFGDAIMFVRYLPLLAKKCKKLTFMCPKELRTLFEKNEHLGVDEYVDSYLPNAKLDIDVHASLLSLPYLLGLKGDDIFESSEGYIIPDMKMVEEYRDKYFNNDKIKVGIKWRGNTTFDKDRVIPAELFNQLICDERAQYYSFQTFEGSEDFEKLTGNVIDIGKDLINFSQTAAALKNLDLVICNDTSLAHLAGAMRIPCWIMLPYEVNWRWHTDLSKCDWYESVKLFRQKAIGDWQSVFDMLKEEMTPD